MKILILGDVGASASNMEAFCKGNNELFSKELLTYCENSDIVLLNLEKPLTDSETPLGRCAPDYCAPTDTINGIMLLRPTAVTLANNHIMDQCEQGLDSTITVLNQHHIKYVGAGKSTKQARLPLIINQSGIKVGIYACCEKEFSVATDTKPGANGFDPLISFDDIAELRSQCDHLIVLYHGGMQDYPYPTPYQQRICRKMCEKGADLVVCQHSHIIGCEEKYADGRIVYGQGNFILDQTYLESWHSGLMIQEILDGDHSNTDYIPVAMAGGKVSLHQKPEEILAAFNRRSEEIIEKEIVENNFKSLCKDKLPGYLIKVSGKNRLTYRIIRRLRAEKAYSKLIYSEDSRNLLLDYLNCDSHREAIITGLELLNRE